MATKAEEIRCCKWCGRDTKSFSGLCFYCLNPNANTSRGEKGLRGNHATAGSCLDDRVSVVDARIPASELQYNGPSLEDDI